MTVKATAAISPPRSEPVLLAKLGGPDRVFDEVVVEFDSSI